MRAVARRTATLVCASSLLAGLGARLETRAVTRFRLNLQNLLVSQHEHLMRRTMSIHPRTARRAQRIHNLAPNKKGPGFAGPISANYSLNETVVGSRGSSTG